MQSLVSRERRYNREADRQIETETNRDEKQIRWPVNSVKVGSLS